MAIHLPRSYRLSPAYMAHLAQRLRGAIEILRAHDLRIGDRGRLIQSARLLDRCALRDRFPNQEDARRRVSNAISTAYEIVQITDYLPPELSLELREDLRRAVGGSLDSGHADAAIRSQTQLHMGAIVASAGLVTSVSSIAKGSVPDFVVEVDGLRIAIEVKRPESEAGVLRSVDRAVSQLAETSVPHEAGAVMLDLSDVLGDHVGRSWAEDVDAAAHFGPLVDRASDHIHTKASRGTDGYERILGLFALAKVSGWHLDLPAHPETRFASYFEIFPGARQGLVRQSSARLRARLITGIETLGGDVHVVSSGPQSGWLD